MSAPRRLRRRRHHGGVTLLLIMVLIVLAALVGVLAVRGASSDLQMAGSQRVSRRGFYCAEAALNYARSKVAANQKDWNTILAGGTTSWYTSDSYGTGVHVDVDGDGAAQPDAIVVMTDNLESDGDLTHDNDLTVILTSTCSSSTLEANGATRTVAQVVTYNGGLPTDYRFQAGHSSSHSGNSN
jgi:Tfp pilus assembly protein PilX